MEKRGRLYNSYNRFVPVRLSQFHVTGHMMKGYNPQGDLILLLWPHMSTVEITVISIAHPDYEHPRF